MTKSPRKIVLMFLFFAVSVCFASMNVWAQSHSVQVASYLNSADAQAEVNRLRAKKLDAYWVKAEIPGIGTRYRVRIGKFNNEAEANSSAAEACKSRAFSQFIVANGDNVPTRANNCRSALLAAAPSKIAPVKTETVVPKPTPTPANVATKNPKTAPAQPVVNSSPLPVTAPKATPKSVSKVSPTPSPATTVAANVPPPAQNKSVTKSNPASVVPTPAANTSKPVPVVPVVEPTFTPAATPGDIVSNAYKYATVKAGRNASTKTAVNNGTTNSESPSSVNSLIARATPGLSADVAIANPKWKVSQANVAGDKNLRSVHFVDPMKGWAAGDGGTIYQTIDGGKQWNQIQNATLAGGIVDVSRIYFVNENKGWMLGETHEGEGRTVLLTTEDGGKIWQNFEMPNVTSFFFVDGKKGWAVGRNATMLKTVDGGIRWKQIENLNRLVGLPVESASSKFGFSDVYFLKGGEVGWAIGNFYGQGTTNIGGLFMTNDGGDNWQRIPIAIQRKTNSTRFTRGKLHSVRFTDVSNGVITGEMEDGDERFFFTLKTRNGGETWEQARVPSSGIHSTQFVDSARGWTAASALREGSAEAKVYDTILLRTDNGGKSWVTDFVAKGKQIRSVFFISPTRGWAVGDRGIILRYEAAK